MIHSKLKEPTFKVVKILQELAKSEPKAHPKTSKGKTNKHILTSNIITDDKPAFSQTGGNSVTFAELN